jgi:hypothetical protein
MTTLLGSDMSTNTHFAKAEALARKEVRSACSFRFHQARHYVVSDICSQQKEEQEAREVLYIHTSVGSWNMSINIEFHKSEQRRRYAVPSRFHTRANRPWLY